MLDLLRHMMMHMTFFWGKNTEVLFSWWPGYDQLGMYILSLVVVFLLAVLVEWLSNCNYIKECSCSWTATLPESLERKRQPTERIYIPGLSYRGQPKKRTPCSYPEERDVHHRVTMVKCDSAGSPNGGRSDQGRLGA
nr:copper transporter 1-like [Ipomoea batatas]GME06603.1 copper transporter 1-like [Ipomoea batatas]